MLVTLSGIIMLLKEEQPQKALPPMLVTLSGITMFVNDLQPQNTLFPILVTPSRRMRLCKEQH